MILFSSAMIMMSFEGESKGTGSNIKEKNLSYMVGDIQCKGFIAYDENVKGKRPVVLIAPEWWGVTDYPKMRARKLAELGYVAMVMDFFGNGRTAANPKEAMDYTSPFYKDPSMVKQYVDAAIEKTKELPQSDPDNIALIGYCFGGYVVLNAGKLGEDVKGIVSFHGGYGGVPVDKEILKARLLICQGAADKIAPLKDAEAFRHKLDSIGADYTYKVYPNAVHAFTNPDATRFGKEFNLPLAYNAEADKNSWNDMKAFLGRVFKK